MGHAPRGLYRVHDTGIIFNIIYIMRTILMGSSLCTYCSISTFQAAERAELPLVLLFARISSLALSVRPYLMLYHQSHIFPTVARFCT